MGEGDGVYYSSAGPADSRRPPRASRGGTAARRLKKGVVALVGLGALGAGAYFGTTLLSGHPPGYVPAGPAALSPAASHTTPATPATPLPSAQSAPGPEIGTKSAARQSMMPSPAPSLSLPVSLSPSAPTLTDDEVAAAQVSRLLQIAPPSTAPGSLTIQGGPVMTSRRVAADGSVIRVVWARFDLTREWSPLGGGQEQAVGSARCTRDFVVGVSPTPLRRPAMLMCWRANQAKSVVTVAIKRRGAPLPAASVEILSQRWSALD